MTTEYTIKFSDQNRTINLAPYTTNGPQAPNNSALHPSATSAATTLVLFGKGMPDYGTNIQENFIHLLENFSSADEPVYPVHGQLWFNQAVVSSGSPITIAPSQLQVYNAYKYQIYTDASHPGNVSWFALNPTNPGDEAVIISRFVNSILPLITTTIRITEESTGNQEDYLIQTTASNNGFGLVSFQVFPAPSSSRAVGGWFVGGWEFVLQNNTPLYNDLDAGGYTVENLIDPVNPQDAATMNYVDTEILNVSSGVPAQLDDLSDVVVTGSPAVLVDGQILVYNSFSTMWENTENINDYLLLTGGTMVGHLNFGSGVFPKITSAPVANVDAVNKLYVDTELSNVQIALDELTDVTIAPIGSPPTISTGSILVLDGLVWKNVEPLTFITDNSIVTLSGATMSGPLYLWADPTQPSEAATKNYVDSMSSIDGVVNGGYYDTGASVLTLQRTNFLPDVTIPMTIAVNSTAVNHTTTDPNLFTDPVGLSWERTNISPQSTVHNILEVMNVMLGKHTPPKGRLVFTADGTNTVVNLSAGSIANQCHTALASDGPTYSVGMNGLNVYINGIKQIASEHGWRDVLATIVAGSPPVPVPFGLWDSTPTGLDSSTTYSFNVSVNGQAPVTVYIDGFEAYRIRHLVSTINQQTDIMYHNAAVFGSPPGTPDPKWAFGVMIHHGAMVFYSSLPGTNSSITITDGSGGSPYDPLFASMVGDGPSGSPPTAGYTITLGTFNTNPFPPADYAYKEIGRVGAESQTFQFATAPPGSPAKVEIIIEPDMFASPLYGN